MRIADASETAELCTASVAEPGIGTANPQQTVPETRDASQPWIGRWTGIAHRVEGPFHVESLIDIEILQGPNGTELIDHDRQRGQQKPAVVSVKDRAFTAKYLGFWPYPIEVSGCFAPDWRTITISMSGAGRSGLDRLEAKLRQDDPAARKYLSPSTDRTGARLFTYHYSAPQAADDGLVVSSAPAEGANLAPLEAMSQSILAETGRRGDPVLESVLILRHGRLIFEEYFWGQSADNPHIISSCTKSITSILVGIAADKGLLQPDMPIIRFFPDKTESLWARQQYQITVRDALSMSAGTAWDQGNHDSSFQMLESSDPLEFILNTQSISPPGSVFNYDNGLPVLLGSIVSRASGEPLERFAEAALFAPLGITNYRWSQLRDGIPLASGAMYLRPRDMLKIGQLMLSGGRWRGRPVVSSQWVHESTRHQTAPGQYAYGYYWHLSSAQNRLVQRIDGFMALGQGGQIIAIFPALDLVVVVTAQNWQSPDTRVMGFDLMDKFIIPAML